MQQCCDCLWRHQGRLQCSEEDTEAKSMNIFSMKRKTSKEVIQNLSQESNPKIQKTVFKEQKARDIKRKTAEECGLK